MKRLAPLLWAVALGLELYWLLWDVPILTPPSLPASLRPRVSLGVVTRISKDVRVQNAQDILWEKAVSPGEVYSGSRIMTLANSSAEISLKDRGILSLQESTLVSLEELDESSKDYNGKLKLLKGNLELQIPQGHNAVALELPSGTKLEVQSGARIRGTTEKLEIIEGEVIDPQSGGRYSSGQSLEVVVDPSSGAALRPLPERVEVSEADPEQAPAPEPPPKKAPPRAPRLRAPQIRKHAPKKESSLHWPSRIFAALFPSAHAAEPELPAFEPLDIDLTWEPVEGAKKYKLQIARDRTFRRIIVETTVDQPSYTWEYQPGMENTKGRVFYRVSSLSETGEAGEFTAAEPLPIPRPDPEKKAERIAQVPPAPVPQPVETPSANTHPHQIRLGVSLSKVTQSTVTRELTSVDEASPFFHETLTYAYEPAQKFRASLSLSQVRWKSDSSTHPTQGELTEMRFRARGDFISGSGNLRWSYGPVIQRSSRFIKSTVTTISTKGAISIGAGGGIGLREERAWLLVTAPLSGLFMDSFSGLEARLLKEFVFDRFSLLPEAAYSIQRWESPTETEVKEWSIATSLGYRF